MNKTYQIPAQLKSFSPRDAQILKLLGIDFAEFTPAPEQKDILLKDVEMSTRACTAIRVLFYDYERGSIDWKALKTMTISQFVSNYSIRDLLKLRNCGMKTVRDINKAIYPYGFELTKGNYENRATFG